MRLIENGMAMSEVRHNINENFSSLGGVLTSRDLQKGADFSFNPRSKMKTSVQKGPAFSHFETNAAHPSGFVLSNYQHGDPASRGSAVSAAYPVKTGLLMHNVMPVSGSNNLEFLGIPTDLSDILQMGFFVSSAQFRTVAVPASSLEITKIKTVEGFETYSLSGILESSFPAPSGAFKLKFEIAIGARISACGGYYCAQPMIQDMHVSGIRVELISGEDRIIVALMMMEANATTNAFFEGSWHVIKLNEPLSATDTLNLDMELLSDMTIVHGDREPEHIAIRHHVHEVNVPVGRAFLAKANATSYEEVNGETGEHSLQTMVKIIVNGDEIELMSALGENWPERIFYGYGMDWTVQRLDVSLEPFRVEVISRAKRVTGVADG